MSLLRIASFLACLGVLVACAAPRHGGIPDTPSPSPSSPDADEAPAGPSGPDSAGEASETDGEEEEPKTQAYRLRPQDEIRIEVFEEPDLTTAQRIDKQGRIRVRLLGTVEIAGMTARQAEEYLESRFQEDRFLRNPMVSISIDEYAPRFIQISGEVANPGNVFLAPEEDSIELVQAILKQGGFRPTANLRKVAITRTLPDGTEQFYLRDVRNKVEGRGQYEPFYLLPGDIVFVHDKIL